MALNKLVRYYSKDGIELIMLKRHKYVCINNYDQSLNNFLQKPQIKQVMKTIARENNMEIWFRSNHSNEHLKEPNAVILEHQGFIFVHPHLANLYFSSVYPHLNIKIKIRAKRDDVQGYIYLLEGSNVLKLGYSTNVANRIKQLSRWENELELIAKIEGTINLEKSIHNTLHLTGDCFGDEWYPLYRKNEILTLMDKCVENQVFQYKSN